MRFLPMIFQPSSFPLILIIALSLVVLSPPPASGMDSREVLALFADPPRECATAPLWVWNDRLTEGQIRASLRSLAEQGVMQVFVHPRPGLMTPYLSDEWFDLWRVALDEATKLDMNVWIYDENSYPSGFAGGFVPDAMPESRGRGLVTEEVDSPPAWSDAHLGVYRLTESGFEDASEPARKGKRQPSGRYLQARVVRAGDSPWHGGKCYVDLLYPGVTEKFLDVTLGAYERKVGDEFGERIPGVFTDEPQILPAGGLPWTEDLPEVFEERWGYSLLEHLPSLTRPVGDWRRVRHNYYQVLNDLFVERWAKPYHDACEKRGLEFTGHYWEHEWPRCLLVPDNMAMYAWHQRPAIDVLMNRYDEGTHAQFGNARAVRELSSVANQLGRTRTLCEAYGASGWELRFEDMKRIADWLFVLGVNTLDEHLSYMTIRGARKKDHPPSFSYHEPWWDDYHVRATYATRLSAALSQGLQVQQFLLLEPTTTAWLYQADPSHAARLRRIGDTFQKLVMDLEMAQVEYDIGSEDIIARHGSYRVRRLKVGQRAYRAVIIPPLTENLNQRTVELLDELCLSGGTVIYCGDPPHLVDGRPRGDGAGADSPATVPFGWEKVAPAELAEHLGRLTTDGFAIRRAAGDQGILFHHRRKLDDGELLFIVNTSDEERSRGKIVSPARGIERWDIETGKAVRAPFRIAGGGVELLYDLPPCGSELLFLSWEPREPAPAHETVTRRIEPTGDPQVGRSSPNVLLLDYCDVAAGGETLEKAYVYRAAQFAFRKNGLARNPWDSAVQFRDEFIKKTFPPESGVKVTYRFTVEKEVPERISVVVERPDLYRAKLNGVELYTTKGAWWLDRSFGIFLNTKSAVKIGENVLTLEASPFSIYHEIEAAYVIGDFGVRPAAAGFAIVPEEELDVGPWDEQRMPFYGAATRRLDPSPTHGGVTYAQSFDLPRLTGRYRVRLPSWNGSVARVAVGGELVGHIEAPPYECEVTSRLKPGRNLISVTIVGTLKNTLGPHHAGPALGAAWPGMFHQSPEKGPPPGGEYATVGYGLMEPFVLVEEKDASVGGE